MISKESYNLFLKLDRNKRVESLKNIILYIHFLRGIRFSSKLKYQKEKTVDKKKRPHYSRRGIGIIYDEFYFKEIYLKEKNKKPADEIVVIKRKYNKEEKSNDYEMDLYEYLQEFDELSTSVFIGFFTNGTKEEFEIAKWSYDDNRKFVDDMMKLSNKQFLLGTGVSRDYGASSWDSLITDMENKIVGINKNLSPAIIKNIIFQNQYGIPQILKDISPKDYYLSISDSLYKYPFISRTYTSLFSISNYIENQYLKGSNNIEVLTYNYDNFLELELLEKPTKLDVGSEWDLLKPSKASIVIKHLHGFVPYGNNAKNVFVSRYKNSIVLTDEDYHNAYSTNKSFAFYELYSFLNKSTIIVGNSVSDYEERKVFQLKHKDDGPYHYLLKIKDELSSIADNYYIFSHLLKLGIITIFVDNPSDITDIINKFL